MNSGEDATRGPQAKVLTIDYHRFIAPEFLYEHENDWPQEKDIVYKQGAFRIVSSSDSHPEDDLYVSGFNTIG